MLINFSVKKYCNVYFSVLFQFLVSIMSWRPWADVMDVDMEKEIDVIGVDDNIENLEPIVEGNK